MAAAFSRVGVSRRSLLLLLVVVGATTACGSDEPTSGSVTIDFELDVSTTPITGSFAVTDGERVIGCAEGTFEDDPGAELTRTMTCTDGDEGTITFSFEPSDSAPGPGDQNGPWQIVDATGDFSGLEGSGDWQGNGTSETIEGEVEFTS